MNLSDYISAHCARAGRTKLRELLAAYRQKTGGTYTRARAIAELTTQGFAVGLHDKVLHVSPLTIPAEYVMRNGELVQA